MNGQRIGMLKVIREKVEWRVVQVQLLPSHQRNGIGGTLIGSLLAESREKGVPVSLSVLKVNPARRLYERFGFVVVSESENAFRMRTAD